ncbi:MAG: undecaprenyldiphospho-muramoylpentapeptide beta-N-acetylglucosaminyltransferase [Vicinamibacteria bacterium]|nr:undecaprenyldiphospho-muramoylpentapeptide beta-N-acetylglucosaminyltransferase [Vicinamibacteria bacterium]
MATRSARAVLIAAGGTGGHLFPGVAVADELRRRSSAVRVVFVGTPRGLETRLVPQAGYELALLPIRPLNRVGFGRFLIGAAALPWGLVRAAALVARLRPQVVLGIGGYAGGPVVLAAAMLCIPTMVLEPNARPGLANRLLRPFVRHAACAYDEALGFFGRKGVLTGNPVRADFTRLSPRKIGSPMNLLVFGGSQGSRSLNRALVDALSFLPGADALRIVHQTGKALHEETNDAYRAAGRAAEVLPFLDDMPRRFAQADLVLSRSGATTCAELTAAGKTAILVPFDRAANDHQRINAYALRDAGAACVIEERELTGESLAFKIRSLMNRPSRLAEMAESARRLGRPEAAARIADLIEQLTNSAGRPAHV